MYCKEYVKKYMPDAKRYVTEPVLYVTILYIAVSSLIANVWYPLTSSTKISCTGIAGLPSAHEILILTLLIELKCDIYVRRTERCISRELVVGPLDRVRGVKIYTDQRLDMHILYPLHVPEFPGYYR
jgi:hypothetical protein